MNALTTVRPTHRTLAYRIERRLRMAWLRWLIRCDEQWIKDCAEDGIIGTLQLQALALELQRLRAELAVIESL